MRPGHVRLRAVRLERGAARRFFAPPRKGLMPHRSVPGARLARAILRHPHRRADHMHMAAPVYYTADMVRALPDDGNRYETVHGELLVTPAPVAPHQYVIRELLVRLHAYLKRHPVGQVFSSPADISWASDVLVQPDVFVVAMDEARTLEWTRMKTLLLAIEVLSPSTRRSDRFTKRRVYQEFGVLCYWMVDLEERVVEVWTPGATIPAIERERLRWQPAGAPEPLVMPVSEILPPLK